MELNPRIQDYQIFDRLKKSRQILALFIYSVFLCLNQFNLRGLFEL